MSETHAELMSLGLTYWPRRTAHNWWRAFDRAEVREELAHVAALGCDTVRFCLRWEDFHPQPQRVSGVALRLLEQGIDVAHEAGLRVVVSLFPVALDGSLQVPAWANRTDVIGDLQRTMRFGPVLVVQPAAQPPLLYEEGYHANQSRDLFDDPAMLDAQRYFIREVVGYFASHPAVWAWQPGEGLERIHRPGSAEAVRAWFATIGEAIRAQHAGARVLGATSARGLTTRSGPRPEHLAALCDILGVAADPPEPVQERPNHSAYVAYLHALTAGLAGAPALVTSLALPTAPDGHPDWIADSAYGRPTRAYLGNAEQQAAFVRATLERLLHAGARGAWLAAYADYPPELWRRPPLDRVTRARSLGVLDASGREKPAADALRAFAAARHTVVDVAPSIEVDPERYWRDPKRSFMELWREFDSDMR
jgi:hypothetical protein